MIILTEGDLPSEMGRIHPNGDSQVDHLNEF